MKWRDRKQSKNVDDRRKSGSSGGGRGMPSFQTMMFLFPIIKPLLRSKFGWAILGIGGIAYMSGFNPLSLVGMGGGAPASTVQNQQADDEKAAFISTVLADTEDAWKKIFAQSGYRYKEPKMVIYRGHTRSGCGGADAQMGPFYCPADETVYIDLSFFDELKTKFGASGDFAEAYILAHEVGHHIQNLQGTLDKVQKAKQGSFFGNEAKKNALQVKVELQADCYAGIWANHTHKQSNMIERGDIDEALGAANSIGDDRLQRQSRGYVTPDSFTHGSSKQRMSWFMRGLKGGTIDSCNTF